jgi:RNA polymerase primary sigma factor
MRKELEHSTPNEPGFPENTNSNILDLYLNEIKQIPLLNHSEEVSLAEKIRGSNDPDAGNKLVLSNLRLVWGWASRHYPKDDPMFMDLIQWGNLGLLRAAEKYDPAMGTKFSTYAVPWITIMMRRGMEKNTKALTVPQYMHEKYRELLHASSYLSQILKEEPNTEQLATFTNISKTKINEINSTFQPDYRIDADMDPHDDGSDLFEDILSDAQSIDPLKKIEAKESAAEISEMLESLDNPVYKQIFELRYGLNGESTHTLKEIEKIVGITAEGVRQIILRGLSKMYNHSVSIDLTPVSLDEYYG